MCLAYVGIACCLKGGLLFSFREGPQRLEPHALPGAARPSGCNGRERERERSRYFKAAASQTVLLNHTAVMGTKTTATTAMGAGEGAAAAAAPRHTTAAAAAAIADIATDCCCFLCYCYRHRQHPDDIKTEDDGDDVSTRLLTGSWLS